MSESEATDTTMTQVKSYPGAAGGALLSRLTFAFGILCAAGASVALAVRSEFLPGLQNLLVRNVLTDGALARFALLRAALVGVMVPLLGGVAFLSIRKRRGVAPLCSFADKISPLCLTVLICQLFYADAWHENALSFLLLLAGFVLLAERLLTRSLNAWGTLASLEFEDFWISTRARRWVPLGIVVAASLAYTIYFSYYTLQNHQQFMTGDFDLGINVNWCYNALEGHPTRTTVLFGTGNGNFLANHAIFAMGLWLPLYALKPGADVLLVYQSFMCGIAAVPLFLFARRLLPSPTAVVVALAYLLFAPLHGPNFYDYHELPVAIVFWFLLYYCILTRRYLWVWVLVPILLAHREDVSLGIVGLGAFLLLSGVRPRLGIAFGVVGATYFALMRFVVMPAAGSWIFADFYKDLQTPESHGGGFVAVIQTALTNPVYFVTTLFRENKLTYMLHMLAPLAFLPARRPVLWVLGLCGFVVTLMPTGNSATSQIAFQYTAHWIPHLFVGAVIVLRLLSQEFGAVRRRAALIAMAVALVCHSAVFGAVIRQDHFVGGFHKVEFQETEAEKSRYEAFLKLVSVIPTEASVLASGNIVPHIGARRNIYPLNYPVNTDYVAVWKDYMPHQLGVLNETFKLAAYGLVGQVGQTIYLFKRGFVSPSTDRAMLELGVQR